MVPHLITALTGPINELEQRVLDSMPAIERWFRLEWMEHTPPFYSSVDVRNAGFKLAPVSTDLFPTAWHQLTPQMMPLAVQAAMAAIEKICPEARNLLVIPKNGTPTPAYLESLGQLMRLFNMAGLNVRLGSIDAAVKKNTVYMLQNGDSITLEPVVRSKRRLGLKDFDPCTVLLNNDLAAGVPGILEELYEQYVLPPLHAGWSQRRKSAHFRSYEEVSKRLGKLIGVDSWLMTPLFDACSEIDPSQARDIEAVVAQTDSLLQRVRRKYKEYGIKEKPFVVVKSDQGPHPLGVVTVRDAKDLEALRGLLSGLAGTSGQTHDFMVQEGVMTCERVNDAVAEPVVYTVDRYVVGGYYRIHASRSVDERLSGPGSAYVPLAFEHSTQLPQPGVKPGASVPNRFYMYGVIARLALVAASYELEATDPEAEAFV
ncbi:MAG: glutamate--cysteine ligase [Rhodoferax sp.]